MPVENDVIEPAVETVTEESPDGSDEVPQIESLIEDISIDGMCGVY
jgi:mycofactocin precursor